MKIHSKLSLILLLVFSFSCDNGIEELEQNQTTQEHLMLKRSSTKSSPQTPTDAEILESFMQYTAFITAQILYHDDTNQVRSEFENVLSTPNQTGNSVVRIAPLQDLLGPNSQASEFENAFEIAFNYYQENNVKNPESCPKGTHPNLNCPDCYTTTGNSLSYESFIDVVINENCLEFYLPNGYDSNDLNNFYSTAHPMEDVNNNIGYQHPASCHEDLAVEVESIDDTDFNQYNNLLVVRPYKTESVFYCVYSDYSDINFTDFLFN